jgi:hypothetical protein
MREGVVSGRPPPGPPGPVRRPDCPKGHRDLGPVEQVSGTAMHLYYRISMKYALRNASQPMNIVARHR